MDDLLASYDADGLKKPIKTEDLRDLSRYKYLVHVCKVNTKNVAGAGPTAMICILS
jgi:hypothetical protein